MNKVLQFFQENNNNKIITKNITVYGWQNEYEHLLITSISKYLFEDLNIIENIAPINDVNRPNIIKPKKYITVHDTGDSSKLHTAKFWSETVRTQKWEQTPGNFVPYACSYQYVVDNEGIYHNIPDEEVAYHAGDGTKFDYTLYDTGIKATSTDINVTISLDGYYEINNIKSNIKAPRIYKEKDGVILQDRLPKTSDLNSQGVLVKIVDGLYYIGETYYSQGYGYICNRGGNNNSIGIESCITDNTDIYYTWQKTAKLVAYLLDNNSLSIDDVKQHHYFSGKNCPQTIRMNGFWDHFIELVKFELQMRQFIKEGYSIMFECDDERVNKIGRIINIKDKTPIIYKVKTIKDNIIEQIELKIEF